MSVALPIQLSPPQTKPHVSAAQLTRSWYVACRGKELKRKPIKRTISGTPLVLFRGESGEARCLLDRCSHRNVPLSLGRVEGEFLQCGYHGWQFDGSGECKRVPGLCSEVEKEGRRVPSFAVREQDGLLWVYLTADTEPETEPYKIPCLGEPGYTSVYRTVDVNATLHATIENALDVPHTAFLHAGLFRGSGEPNDIEAVVRRYGDRVEAEYIGEPRPEGLAARILSPGGGVVQHFDRFLLPSVAQVEYRLGDDIHLFISSICTPIRDFETRMHAVICFKLRLPGWLVKPVLEPIARKIFAQDAQILRAQTETIQRFGGEQYASTEVDLLGGHIWRLLKRAASDEGPPGDTLESEQRVQLKI